MLCTNPDPGCSFWLNAEHSFALMSIWWRRNSQEAENVDLCVHTSNDCPLSNIDLCIITYITYTHNSFRFEIVKIMCVVLTKNLFMAKYCEFPNSALMQYLGWISLSPLYPTPQTPCSLTLDKLRDHSLCSGLIQAPPRLTSSASLFLLNPAHALILGPYVDSSKLSYTTTSGITFFSLKSNTEASYAT